MQDKKPFKDRLALVTGASRGIGRAVALELARQGAHVVIAARTIGGLEELDDEIRAFGGKATLIELDIRKGDKVDQLGPTLYQRWGKLDILVSSAGILGPLSPLHHVTEDAWSAVIETNLSANWRLIRSLDPLLKRSDARARGIRHCRRCIRKERLLGAVCRFQGRPRSADQDLRQRGREHAVARQPRQPGAGAHAAARQGLPGRGPDDAADAGGRRAALP